MIGILKFRLPQEEQEFKDAQNGAAIKYALQDFDNWLRGIVKHGSHEEQLLTADAVREKLYETMSDTGWREP